VRGCGTRPIVNGRAARQVAARPAEISIQRLRTFKSPGPKQAKVMGEACGIAAAMSAAQGIPPETTRPPGTKARHTRTPQAGLPAEASFLSAGGYPKRPSYPHVVGGYPIIKRF